MRGTPNRIAAVLGVTAFPVISWMFAATYVAAHAGFGAGDLWAFGFWSVLPALPAYPVLRLFDRRSHSWTAATAYGAAVFLGLVGGVLWTLVVASILGGWIGAFSFPVLLCWLSGSLAAFITCALTRRVRTWPVAVALVPVPVLAAFAALGIVFARPPDLLIHVAPATTPEQLETIHSEVLGIPSPTGHGYAHIDGVQTVSRADRDGEARIRVGFFPGTSDERRAKVVDRVLASPLVARTSDLEATAGNQFSANIELPPGTRIEGAAQQGAAADELQRAPTGP